MYICSVEVDECKVIFESSRNLVPAFLRLAETPAFLGFYISSQASLNGYKVYYKEDANEVFVKYSSKTVSIRAPWSSIREGETLLYAAFPFIELQRQQQGFVTIHAAAVSFERGAVLILGKEGSGKTMTAIGLCRSYGARLIGNDLVIIGSTNGDSEIIARSGTKFLSLRYESIRRNIPELLNFFPEWDEDPWLCKVLISPEEAGINLCCEEVSLGGVFLVHVDETKNELFVKSADTVANRLYLNENFLRYIRGACIMLFDEKLRYLGYVPSFDSEKLFLRRAKLMERLFVEYSMKFVSGPLGRVVGYIASQRR